MILRQLWTKHLESFSGEIKSVGFPSPGLPLTVKDPECWYFNLIFKNPGCSSKQQIKTHTYMYPTCSRVWKGGVLIPHSCSFFMKISHPTFFFYRYPTSHAQFWWIPLPVSSQIPNPAPFFSKIPDPVNTLPDPDVGRSSSFTKYNSYCQLCQLLNFSSLTATFVWMAV